MLFVGNITFHVFVEKFLVKTGKDCVNTDCMIFLRAIHVQPPFTVGCIPMPGPFELLHMRNSNAVRHL